MKVIAPCDSRKVVEYENCPPISVLMSSEKKPLSSVCFLTMDKGIICQYLNKIEMY